MRVKILSLVLFVFLLSPVFASPIDYVLQPNNITMNISQSENVALRIVHTNETNTTIPINLSFISILPLKFSKNNFNLKVYKNVEINISVPSKHLKSGVYKPKILIRTPNQTFELPFKVKINSTKTYNFTNIINKEFNQTEKGVFYINITNNGNTNLNLPVKTEAFFESVDKLKVPVGMSVELPVFYNVPKNQTSGKHLYKIQIGEKNLTINTTVVDTTKPTLNANIPDKIYVGRKLDFKNVTCVDNENVTKLQYKIRNTTYNITTPYVSDSPTELDINFVCVDNYNNTKKIEKTLLVKKIPIENLNSKIEIKQRKEGADITKKLFSVPSSITPTVTLRNFNYTGKVDIMLRSNTSSLSLSENTSTDMRIKGDVSIELSNFDKTGEYEGTLIFDFGPKAETSKVPIKISGEIGEYEVPEKRNVSVANLYGYCEGIDKGSLSKSYDKCCLRYPLNTNITDKGYLITPNILNDLKKKCKLEKKQIKDESELSFNILLFITIILGGILALLFLKHYVYEPTG